MGGRHALFRAGAGDGDGDAEGGFAVRLTEWDPRQGSWRRRRAVMVAFDCESDEVVDGLGYPDGDPPQLSPKTRDFDGDAARRMVLELARLRVRAKAIAGHGNL